MSNSRRGENLPRISLSMKATEKDPWNEVIEKFKEAESYSAKVVRLTKFGAFVELIPGVDGLIHISEMSWIKRVKNPNEILKIDDVVTVRILKIDLENKKISLSF